MPRIIRYIATSSVTYPAPNKFMSVVVSLLENIHRKIRKKIARAMIVEKIRFIFVFVKTLKDTYFLQI
mgnify:FL=1